MYILKKKSKNSIVYYLCKSYRNANKKKNSTKVVEKLGTSDEINARFGKIDNLDQWLKNYAAKKTEEDKNNSSTYSVDLNTDKRISKKYQRIYNGGYFAFQKIFYLLKIDEICKAICKKTGFKYNLTEIVSSLVYDRILSPSDENSYKNFINLMIENKKFSKKELNEAIKVLSQYYDYIQYALFLNARDVLNLDISMIFNECMHYCYDVNQYNKKEEKKVSSKSSLNVVQVDLFYDKNGIPLAFSNNSYKNPNYEHNPIIDAVDYWKDKSQIISFSDNLPSQLIKDIKKSFDQCYEIKNLNIRLLKKHLREWILNKEGWNAWGTSKIYNLGNVENLIYDNSVSNEKRRKLETIIFYKYCKLPIGDSDKFNNLLVGFSFLAKKDDRLTRNSRYEKIKKALDKQIVEQYEKDPELCKEFFIKFKKFLGQNMSEEGKSDSFFYDFDEDMVNEENAYDGFFACLADQKVENFENIIYNRLNSWMVDYVFSTMDRDFRVIPDEIPKHEAINAHLIVSYMSLLVMKVFQKQIKGRFYLDSIKNEMLSHNYIKIPGQGWCPSFMPNEISDALDEICGIKSDYEFISEKQMREIIQKTKQTS